MGHHPLWWSNDPFTGVVVLRRLRTRSVPFQQSLMSASLLNHLQIAPHPINSLSEGHAVIASRTTPLDPASSICYLILSFSISVFRLWLFLVSMLISSGTQHSGRGWRTRGQEPKGNRCPFVSQCGSYGSLHDGPSLALFPCWLS